MATGAELGKNVRKGQEVLSRLDQPCRGTCTGPEAALLENRLQNSYLTLFSSLRDKKGVEAENKDAKRSFTAINHSQTTFCFYIPPAIQRYHKHLIGMTSNVMP